MDLIEIFKEHLKIRRLSENTVKSYLFDIEDFLRFEDFKNKLSGINRGDLRRYFAYRKEE
jgi:site-specific recombinase XerD